MRSDAALSPRLERGPRLPLGQARRSLLHPADLRQPVRRGRRLRLLSDLVPQPQGERRVIGTKPRPQADRRRIRNGPQRSGGRRPKNFVASRGMRVKRLSNFLPLRAGPHLTFVSIQSPVTTALPAVWDPRRPNWLGLFPHSHNVRAASRRNPCGPKSAPVPQSVSHGTGTATLALTTHWISAPDRTRVFLGEIGPLFLSA